METFSQGDIAEIVRVPPKVVAKVAESPLLRMAPLLDPETGMVLVGILEKRMRELYPEPASAAEPEAAPSPGPR